MKDLQANRRGLILPPRHCHTASSPLSMSPTGLYKPGNQPAPPPPARRDAFGGLYRLDCVLLIRDSCPDPDSPGCFQTCQPVTSERTNPSSRVADGHVAVTAAPGQGRGHGDPPISLADGYPPSAGTSATRRGTGSICRGPRQTPPPPPEPGHKRQSAS